MDQISDFKLSIKLSAVYQGHCQMDIMEQATTKKFVKNFDLMKHFGVAGQSLGLPS